jgi:TPP-dependent pyruvate/acetoin dehydrogenase alpha subunit
VRGFKLPYSKASAADFDNLYETLKTAVDKVRTTRSPQFVEVLTHRFCGHSKSDKRSYIPTELDEYWHVHDTIKSVANQFSEAEVTEIFAKVEARVEECYEYCINN